MDKIIRCITSDGAVMVSAIDSTDIAYKASVLHDTSPVASAALGRLLSAARPASGLVRKAVLYCVCCSEKDLTWEVAE